MNKAYVAIFCGNSLGLENDAIILKTYVESHFPSLTPVIIKSSDKFSKNIKKLWDLIVKKREGFEVIMVHIEELQYALLWLTKHHFIIPNQEWFRSRTEKFTVSNTNVRVLCKTKHAVEVFHDIKDRVHFIGSISPNRYMDNVKKDYSRYLHLSGKSRQKGTLVLLKAWTKHPEWPVLTLISKVEEHIAAAKPITNVNVLSEHLTDEDLAEIMNTHGIHVCPSEVEGFGANIVEAMSTGAVVITTDAPPMNELVTQDTGLLLSCREAYKQYRGTGYAVNVPAIESAIAQTLNMSGPQLQELSGKSMQRYAQIKDNFEVSISYFFTNLINSEQENQQEPRESTPAKTNSH